MEGFWKFINLTLIIVFGLSLTTLVNGSLLDKIKDDSDLSQFYDLVTRNEVAMFNFQKRSLTVFAPTNEAFQRYGKNDAYVQYHMSTDPLKLDDLGKTVITDFDGYPSLYITKDKDNIWVNNARIVRSRSNDEGQSENGKPQVLHVIEDVLIPLTPNPSASRKIYNPDAYELLENVGNSINIENYRFRSFYNRVILQKKEYVYKASGGHTFFIPDEEGFKPHPRPELIDKKVIDGHVIYNQVLFTASAPLEEQFKTLAFEDNIKVTISFFTQGEGNNKKTYVKSNTILPDSNHPNGVVMAEIVKANIPVRNGVVHIIHRPLVIVDNTVKQFLEEKVDGPLFKFHEAIMDNGNDFMERINKMQYVTILAPNNAAFNQTSVQNIIRDRAKMREILNLHIIPGQVNTEKIRQNNLHGVTVFQTVADRKNIYFNIVDIDGGNKTVTVEGAGVNATVIQSDIVQTNGYVHIIDRVLGIPYATIYDKLRTDPMLNLTNMMGQQSGFNEQLSDSSKRFTYFVPSDKAWRSIRIEYPSVHKKLFMNGFEYHQKSILQRHLVISDKVFKMSDLRRMSGNDSIALLTSRGSLSIKVRDDQAGYSIYWNNKKIPVFRPDVECTNGIIHVIDLPFLEESDVQVNEGSSLYKAIKSTAISVLITILVFSIF